MEKASHTAAKMGRPRQFDEDAALDAAMRVFWQKGYEGTSLDDLTEAMGINRSSLYSTFGDKQRLFRKVVQRYQSGPLCFLPKALAEPSARAVTEALLRLSVKFFADPSHPPGCLSMQGGMAYGSGNQDVQKVMIEWRTSGLTQLQQRMQRAKAEGDLEKDVNPKDLARLIMILMNGLSVQAVNGATPAEMTRAVELALRSLPL